MHVTYEETDQVKETKINILLRWYEAFKMKPKEFITDMFSSFIEIVNGLVYQGQPISRPIRETQRIMPLSEDEFVGTLQSYEVEQINEEEDPKGKKSIALKSNNDSNDTDSEDDLDDEELALMIRRFGKLNSKGKMFNWKKQGNQRFQNKSNEDNETNKGVICFKCKKKWHIRPNYPLLKKKKEKAKKFKKALKAKTWSNT